MAAAAEIPQSDSNQNVEGNTSSSNCSAKKESTVATKQIAEKKKKPTSPPISYNRSSPRSFSKKKMEEKLLAEKVMKGDFCSYAVFTGKGSVWVM